MSNIIDPSKLEIPYLTDRPTPERFAKAVPPLPGVARLVGSLDSSTGLNFIDAKSELMRYIILLECGRHDEIAFRVNQGAVWRQALGNMEGGDVFTKLFISDDAAEAAAWWWAWNSGNIPRYKPMEYPALYASMEMLRAATNNSSVGTKGKYMMRKTMFSRTQNYRQNYSSILERAKRVAGNTRDQVVLPSLCLYQPVDLQMPTPWYSTSQLPWSWSELQIPNKITTDTSMSFAQAVSDVIAASNQAVPNQEGPPDAIEFSRPSGETAATGMLWFLLNIEFRNWRTARAQSDRMIGDVPTLEVFPEKLRNETRNMRRQISNKDQAIKLLPDDNFAFIDYRPATVGERDTDAVNGILTWKITRNGVSIELNSKILERGGGGDCFYKSFFDALRVSIGEGLSPGIDVGRPTSDDVRRSLLDYLSDNFRRLEYLRHSSEYGWLPGASQTLLNSYTAAFAKDVCIQLNTQGKFAEDAVFALAAEAYAVELVVIVIYAAPSGLDQSGRQQFYATNRPTFQRHPPSHGPPTDTIFLFNIAQVHFQLISPDNIQFAVESFES